MYVHACFYVRNVIDCKNSSRDLKLPQGRSDGVQYISIFITQAPSRVGNRSCLSAFFEVSMSSVAENDKGPIILAGPNVEALDDFRNTLSEVLAQTQEIKERPNDIRVLLGKELLKQNLDSSVKCFLVMPCASRTLIYLEGDRSSMYQELKHMCCDDGQWNYHRGITVT